jgi:hypothetical protein
MKLPKHFFVLALTFGFAVSCQDKPTPEPTSDSSSGDSRPAEPGPKGDYGAKVGSDEMRKQLAVCNEEGYFFDRDADNGKGGEGACDEKRVIADFACTDYDDTVQAMGITGSQLEKLDSYLKNEYKDYLFDQCVEGASEFVLYLVKETVNKKTGYIEINVSHITIVKP